MGVCSNIYVHSKFTYTYTTSFHALGQVHIYARSQGNKKITAKEMLKNLYRQNSEIEDLTFSIMRKYAKRFFLNEDFERLLCFLIVCILRNYIVNCRPCYLSSLYQIILYMRLARLQKKTNVCQGTLSTLIPRLEITREHLI